MKVLLALLSLVILTTPLAANSQQFGDLSYTSDGLAITITGSTGSNGPVTIPESIIGLPVSAIGDNAFATSSLTGVTIPGSVISIGSSAFYKCTNLTGITIANGVTKIGRTAFSYCSSLTNVFLPGSVSLIDGAPFSSCTNLAAIMVDPVNPSFSSVDGVLFDKNQLRLIQYPAGKTGSYALPDTAKEIGLGAFANCGRLTGVILPDTLKNIGMEALHHCINLTHVTIPSSVTNIGHDAFRNCTGLASVELSEGLTTIGWAFRFCTNLTSITIPHSVTFIWEQAFDECTGMKGIFFKGNAPSFSGSWTLSAYHPTGYYLPGTTGWGATFAGQPMVLWNPLIQSSGPGFGIGPAGFSFNITGTTNIPIVVEATTNPANANWLALQSLNLTDGTFNFSDPNWTNSPTRHYRIRSP
jgi:BspA type Leucine rich repeat region (6 copies)